MQCETCGKHIAEGKKVKLEGSVVVTCNECAACGEVVGEAVKREAPKPLKKSPEPQKPVVEVVVESEVLAEDYGERIRRGREKRGMKQEDLAKSLNEPASLIHRLESGRFEPGDGLVRKLEKMLGIRLLEKTNGLNVSSGGRGASKELTLGDVVVVKKRK
ncbi:MAG: TIGR00270 family protein [Candidatus Altiarchaeota archaeon]|nr:TIGR00270 family protein [Candidatus Altiarchaeota archaeon]